MDIWNYVSNNTYDSPEFQIKLLLKKVKEQTKRRNLRILDAGGGLVSRENLLEKLGKRTVLDVTPGKNVTIVGDIHKTPFPDNSFDLITLFMVMEHLYDPLKAIKECRRILKKNGILIATTVQYWHTHGHPNDYYRYTKAGLEYIFNESDLPILNIWSIGGPFLVLYHVIELNIPNIFRKFFMLTCPIFNYLDYLFFNHQDKRKNNDSVGWAFIAKKIIPK